MGGPARETVVCGRCTGGGGSPGLFSRAGEVRGSLSPPPSAMPIPTPLADNQLLTLDWDPRLGEDHG